MVSTRDELDDLSAAVLFRRECSDASRSRDHVGQPPLVFRHGGLVERVETPGVHFTVFADGKKGVQAGADEDNVLESETCSGKTVRFVACSLIPCQVRDSEKSARTKSMLDDLPPALGLLAVTADESPLGRSKRKGVIRSACDLDERVLSGLARAAGTSCIFV